MPFNLPPFPPANLPGQQQKWGRAVEKAASGLAQEVVYLRSQLASLTSAKRGTTGRLQTQVQRLEDQVSTLESTTASLQDVTSKLTAAGQVVDAQRTINATNFTGFYTGTRPSAKVTSPTGRINVLWGGSMNGGNGYFVFSVTGPDGTVYKNRQTMQQNLAERLAISGGSNFTPSGYSQISVAVPVGVEVTVTLEFYAEQSFVYLAAGRLQVSASL